MQMVVQVVSQRLVIVTDDATGTPTTVEVQMVMLLLLLLALLVGL